jgi:hypothetical protein
LTNQKRKGENQAKLMDLSGPRFEVSSFSRRLNVSALQVVGALGAVLGSGIVLYLLVQIDALSAPHPAESTTAQGRKSHPTLEQKAA